MDKAYLRRLHQQARPKNLRPRAASWYEIKNLSADTAEISLYDEVGLWGVTASAFADDLRGVTVKNITLRISSPGGDVFDGLAILNSLRQHPATVNVLVEGLAASAASFIAMAGDTIQVAPQGVASQTLANECLLTDYAVTRASGGEFTWTVPGVLADGSTPAWS
ncbi:ATP-dependent Clp protease proteolytic subunit [Streptomyces sp. NPDC058818]|uniref:Clp protease ClpP n=1 Tax=Streptomyces sp. NPDC058818 TaxID=3346640 RepID=UPI00368E7EBD